MFNAKYLNRAGDYVDAAISWGVPRPGSVTVMGNGNVSIHALQMTDLEMWSDYTDQKIVSRQDSEGNTHHIVTHKFEGLSYEIFRVTR